ncbi:MAG: MATE family efflux transporter [Cyclobacteriaceae bacterium]
MNLKQHLSKTVTLAYPVMIGQLGHILVSVADTAMVGRVGVIPLAGATFAGTIYHALLLFGIGVSYAITPLVAAAKKGDRALVHGYLQNALILNGLLGLLLFGLGYGLTHFLDLFGQEEAVVEAAGPYLLIVLGSLIPLMIFQTFRQYAEGLSDTLNPMVVSIVSNLINVGLNYMLIFGHLGFEPMGLNGAGYATFISRVVMVLMIMMLTRSKWRGLSLGIDFVKIKRLFKLGIPSGMQYLFEVGAFATAAIMVGWIGAAELAAHQIALNIAAVSYMAATGIASAATIRVGNQMGSRDKNALRLAGNSAFGLAASFMGITGLVFIIFNSALAGLYVEDQYVVSVAAQLLIVAAAFQVSDGLQSVGLGVLRGLTDVKVPTAITFMAYWVFAIPAGYVLGFVFELGVLGIWYALASALTIAAIFHMLRFRSLVRRLGF